MIKTCQIKEFSKVLGITPQNDDLTWATNIVHEMPLIGNMTIFIDKETCFSFALYTDYISHYSDKQIEDLFNKKNGGELLTEAARTGILQYHELSYTDELPKDCVAIYFKYNGFEFGTRLYDVKNDTGMADNKFLEQLAQKILNYKHPSNSENSNSIS